MKALRNLYQWFDIRPGESRGLWLSFLAAFLVLAALTLGRSLREALYLAHFDVRTLPYITAAVAFLSLPLVGIFTRLLAHRSPRRVLRQLVLIQVAGLLVMWPIAAGEPLPRSLIVALYIWTALGIMLIASGFWVVTAELFAVRGAKRLFGLISAGGTAGAMTMGISLGWLTRHFPVVWLLPLLAALFLLFLLAEAALPGRAAGSGPEPDAAPGSSAETGAPRPSTRENIALIWHTKHLRIIALIIMTATMASTLVDYQFKEAVRASFSDQADLTSFFGAFYGWTGAAALLIQLFAATRLMASAGIGASLAVLPLLLLLGSAGFALLPGLLLVTLVRGADNSLRKSLFRPVMEFLYVPLPAALRRRTKTFIDSFMDSMAEGLGAALVFLWVTLLGLSSRGLSVFVILLSGAFLLLSRRMDRQYLATIVTRLREGEASSDVSLDGRDRRLLSATFTQMEIHSLLLDRDVYNLGAGPAAAENAAEAATEPAAGPKPPPEKDRLAQLRSADIPAVLAAMTSIEVWEEEHIDALLRLLARDALAKTASEILIELSEQAVSPLAAALGDESTDFVVRRRIPRVLAEGGGEQADDALLGGLSANRFEVRYRSAIALARRRKRGLAESRRDWRRLVWEAVRGELRRERPVWELQKLLDGSEPGDDDLVLERVGARGELSLEHSFRLLALVLEPEPVRAAFQGVLLGDEHLRSYALEYLDQVLPADIRKRLWLFIGDLSERQRARAERPLNDVVSDLMSSRATLFAGGKERDALRRLLTEREKGD